MIYIFIRNKLISCDSITPIALEINRKFNHRCRFITFKKKTYDDIERNYFLKDAIDSMGDIRYIGFQNFKPFDILKKASFLIEVFYNLIFRKAYIIHFNNLNSGRLAILTWIIPEKRLFISEPDSSGFSKFMFQVDYCRRDYEYSISKSTAPKKGRFLAFGDEWMWLKDERTKHFDTFIIKHPRSRATWRNFVLDKSDMYFKDLNIKKGKVISMMLGFFGHIDILKDDTTVLKCFKNTIKAIAELDEKIVLLLKPHTITNMNILKEVLSEYPNLDYRITYLHPSLIATRSSVVICNYYTTSIYDAYLLGVPTIEYTDYHEKALEISGNKSCRPSYVTYFLNNESQEALKTTLIKSLNSSKEESVINTSEEGDLFFDQFK